MDLLPDELLVDILGRLPPCSLAASRCARKDWCAIIDTRRLLRADLLPLRLDGFFCLVDAFDGPRGSCIDGYETVFFSRPSTGRRISGHLDLLQDDDHDPHNPWLWDHCNGLILLFSGVIVNPATGQFVSLPPYPEKPCVGMGRYYKHAFLAYNPIVSPHYEIVFIPSTPNIQVNNKAESEWPPSPFTTHVFSSRKQRWEERSFVREGQAAGTIAEMDFDYWTSHRVVYLRGLLYVPYRNNSYHENNFVER
ncbi:hypothetical protein PR202_gb05890 [Eleusine coracana subsp. coracana]|uniref:F-box domain-containing protein n=1 Tax=Eleusine coracana subsp. coracana TaxID=191504 RepID=A0AAV5E8X4_ELECO|nr:hypothetical protein PR202_gb05890 [Eleusine coracana subsp. coracana]